MGSRTIFVKSGKRKQHTRTIKVTEPKAICDCSYDDKLFYPAKLPECNVSENYFNWLRAELRFEAGRSGWPKNVNELEKRLVILKE